jgi:hypothetical protein
MAYVTEVLAICRSYPFLQERLLDAIVNQCIELDVDIVIEDTGEARIATEDEEGEEGNGDDEMFFPLDEASGGRATRRRGRGIGEAGLAIRGDVADAAHKLDTLLMALIAYIEEKIMDESEGARNEKGRLFDHLMRSFEARVMLTYRSKFVQFVIFYVGCREPEFGRGNKTSFLRYIYNKHGKHIAVYK